MYVATEEFVVEDVVVSDMEGMGLETIAPKARAGKESVKPNALDVVHGTSRYNVTINIPLNFSQILFT